MNENGVRFNRTPFLFVSCFNLHSYLFANLNLP
jgi:hypothetical protein